MKSFFYSIVSSGLIGAKNNDSVYYKSTTFIILSLILVFNMLTINTWLNAFGLCKILNFVEVDAKNKYSLISGFIHGFFNFGIFSMLLGYFTIYYKKKYISIMKKYPQKNGNLMIIYLVVSLLIMILTGITSRWLWSIGLANKFTYMEPFWIIKPF